MEIKIESGACKLDKYKEVLDKYNLRNGKITLNNLEDMMNLVVELGHSVIVDKYFDDEEPRLMIYDGYLE